MKINICRTQGKYSIWGLPFRVHFMVYILETPYICYTFIRITLRIYIIVNITPLCGIKFHKNRFKRFINPELWHFSTQCQRYNNTPSRSRVYYKQITVTVFQTLTKIQFRFSNIKIFS